MNIRAALLASAALAFPLAARAAPAWHTPEDALVSNSNGASFTFDCVLGTTPCANASAIASGDLVVVCVNTDSGGAGPPTAQFLDASNNPIAAAWTLDADQSNFGNAESTCLHALSPGLTSGQKIRMTSPAGPTFPPFMWAHIGYLDGFSQPPQIDSVNSAQYGSTPTTATPSGPVTTTRLHDAIFGFASSKLGSAGYTQDTGDGFGSPTGVLSANGQMIGGSQIDASGSVGATFNYQPTQLATGLVASSIVLAFTTQAGPPNLIGQQGKPQLNMGMSGVPPIPDVALANNLTLNTFLINNWTATQAITVDYAQHSLLGPQLRFGTAFFQSCNPADTTLNILSATVGECGGGYQDTLDTAVPAASTGSATIGKAFRGDAYYEMTASFPVACVSPTWQAPIWLDAIGAETPTTRPDAQWPAFPGTLIEIEIDYEHFMCNFSDPIATSFFSIHDHYGNARQFDFQTQITFAPGSGVAFYPGKHRYGMRLKHATNTLSGGAFFYVDGTLIGSIPWTKFSFDEVAASSLSTSQSTLTMTMPVPSTSIGAGYGLVNDRTGCVVTGSAGITSYVGTLITLPGNSLCAGLANDPYTLAPPPPPQVSSGSYVSATGLITANIPSTSAALPGQMWSVALQGINPSICCGPYPVVSASPSTVVFQGPTGAGNGTVTGGQIIPPWFYGPTDNQQLDVKTGYVNAPYQGTDYQLGVWQASDDLNLQPF